MGNQLLSRPVYILARNIDHFRDIKTRMTEVLALGYEPIYLSNPDMLRGVRTAIVFFEKEHPPTELQLHVLHRYHVHLLEVKMKEINHG